MGERTEKGVPCPRLVKDQQILAFSSLTFPCVSPFLGEAIPDLLERTLEETSLNDEVAWDF